MSAAAERPTPLPSWPHYRCERLLGQGASGSVYLARDAASGAAVAVKRFRPELREQAAREAGVLAGVRFPGVVELRDATVDPADGSFLAVFELIEGQDLFAATARSSYQECAALLADVLRALAFVHRRGIVHRDLKPENLLVAARDGAPAATLIDFGLAAAARDAASRAAGTLAYLAPEVLAGAVPDRRSDLYSAGIILYQLLARRLPSAGRGAVDVVRLHLAGDLALPPAVASHLPQELVDLVATLLRRDPALRLASAAEALEALARATQQQLPLETPRTLAGRVRSMEFPLPEGLRERLVEHGAGSGSIAVTLPVGSAVALRRLCVAWAAAGRVVFHVVLGAGRALPPETAAAVPAAGRVYLVECAGPLSDAEDAYAARLLAVAAERSRGIAVVIACEDDRPLPPWLTSAAPARLELPRPARGQVTALVKEALGLDLGAADLRRLNVASDFTPLSVMDGLCRLIEAGVLGAEGDRPQWNRSRRLERLAAESSVARAAAVVAGLPEADRAFLQVLSLPGLPVLPALAERMRAEFSAGVTVSSLADLLERGLLEFEAESGSVTLASEALAEALRAGLAEPELTRLQGRAGRLWLEERPEDAEALGEAALLLLAGGAAEEALPLLVDAGARLRCAGRSSEGRRYLERALSLCPAGAAPAARLRVLRWLADCESLEGRNAEAARLAREALSLQGAADDLGRCHAVLARTLLRLGELEEAGRILAAGLALAEMERTTRALLLTTRSMMLRARQEHEAAAAAAEEALLAAGSEATLERGAALMTLANAHGFLGRVDEAVAAYQQAEELGRTLGREDMSALAAANLGRLLFEHGRVSEAVALLEPVLESFERSGSIRHAETMLLTLMPARGALGDIAGVRALGLKGRSFFNEDSAQVNRAMFLRHLADAELCAGNLGEAERLARESVAIRERVSLPLVLAVGLAHLVRVLLRQERLAEARAALARATRLVRSSQDAPAREETAAAAAEAHLLEDRAGAAVLAARRALQWARRMRPPRQLHRAAGLLGLALLRRGDPAGALQQIDAAVAAQPAAQRDGAHGLLLGARAAALDLAGRGTEAEGEFERSLACLAAEGHASARARVLLLRARCRERAAAAAREPGSSKGILELASLVSQARSDVAQARAQCTSLCCGAGLKEAGALDADLDALESLAGDGRPALSGLERRIRSMERLLEVNKAINSELDPQRLLNLILDEAIDLCRARRGFLILVQGAKIDVRVARNFAEQDIQHPEFQFSHSVARQVALSGEPIRTSNALHDQRLRSFASIVELRVTSILCVPLRSGEQLLGSIYLDHPDVVDRFDQGDLELLADFAAAAGIALERARLYQENSERAGALASAKREIERLNAELMKTVAAQARELNLAKDVIEAEKSAAARRYDYRNIVTQSSRMEEVLRLLDRITETDFPVLIQGESGTGKELVARAIHYNGPRARGNFVSVNCAAVPEPLIEAELFGYMKGAFTGADRDRPGLFEIADGGTLFLDEIGDMSLEVQKRLLRVVQHGEFFRVGGKDPVRVKVRVISATHRVLKELMAAGQFREDLFYRLNVAAVTLPPVRERAGDVPLLVQFFSDELVKAGLAPARTFSREALAALQKYPWPGNVREIQNEVRRLMCLKTDRESIELEDLAPGIVEAARLRGTAAPRGLKAQLEEHRRAIILATLAEVKGNKAEAARRLGLTVRGLYKALDRLDLPGTDEP